MRRVDLPNSGHAGEITALRTTDRKDESREYPFRGIAFAYRSKIALFRGRRAGRAKLREVTQIDRGNLSNLDFTPGGEIPSEPSPSFSLPRARSYYYRSACELSVAPRYVNRYCQTLMKA